MTKRLRTPIISRSAARLSSISCRLLCLIRSRPLAATGLLVEDVIDKRPSIPGTPDTLHDYPLELGFLPAGDAAARSYDVGRARLPD